MDFIKKYKIPLICGLVGLLAIISIPLAFVLKFSKVEEGLNEMSGLYSQVNSLASGVQVVRASGRSEQLVPNQDAIELINTLRKEAESVLYSSVNDALAISSGQRTTPRLPLLWDQRTRWRVFPEPNQPTAVPYEFSDEYRKALDNLLVLAQAGRPVTQEDIVYEDQQAAMRLGRAFGGTDDTGQSPGRIPGGNIPGGMGMPGGGMDAVMPGMDMPMGGTGRIPGGRRGGGAGNLILPETSPHNAMYRRAMQTKVYADLNSLDIIQGVYQSTEAPSAAQMWMAQVSLWIQRDIVQAIIDLNEDSDNVETAPVKRLVSIYVEPYATQGGTSSRSGGRANAVRELTTGVPAGCMTERVSNELYDVVRFETEMVVDGRDVITIIETMLQQNLYTAYDFSISAVPQQQMGRSGDETGLYVYGYEPVVTLIVSWETYMLRDYYHWGIDRYLSTNPQTNELIVHTIWDADDASQAITDSPEGRQTLRGFMPPAVRTALSQAAMRGGMDYR